MDWRVGGLLHFIGDHQPQLLSLTMKKSQLVFVPCPGIGHLMSIVEFAKLLINHDHRLSVTLLVIKLPHNATCDAFIQSLASSHCSSGSIQFILLPTKLPSEAESHHPSSFLEALIENQKPHVRDAVNKLKSGPDSPSLAGFVVDMFCTAMNDIAGEFGVPAMVFFTSGAAFLSLMLHLHTLRERDGVDTTAFGFKDSGVEFAIPGFANPVPANALPNIVLDKNWESFFFNYVRGLKKAKGIIVNTFEELESHAVHSFSNGDLAVYPVGPILSLSPPKQGSADVIEWLDDQPPSSVIYLCFGSKGYFENDNQVKEIAHALEKSGVRFLWSLRKPAPESTITSPTDYSNFEGVLPDGFLERTAGIGRVIGWAPQTQILANRAVGGFVSHCGWNSTLESIYYGVPMATWPLSAEQQMNAFLMVRELGMAVEISLDYRIQFDNGKETEVLSAERIEKGIKEVMKEESEVRKKVKQMSEISRKALNEGGLSYFSLYCLINDIMNDT